MTSPLDMFTNLVQLRDGGEVGIEQRGRRGEIGSWTVSAFHADSDASVHANHWERHPVGDEVLYVLSGAVRVHLRADQDAPPTTLGPGTCYVVPSGQWHRLTVEEPTDLLTITPRANTEHERVS